MRYGDAVAQPLQRCAGPLASSPRRPRGRPGVSAGASTEAPAGKGPLGLFHFEFCFVHLVDLFHSLQITQVARLYIEALLVTCIVRLQPSNSNTSIGIRPQPRTSRPADPRIPRHKLTHRNRTPTRNRLARIPRIHKRKLLTPAHHPRLRRRRRRHTRRCCRCR